jgi:hypothetical protein
MIKSVKQNHADLSQNHANCSFDFNCFVAFRLIKSGEFPVVKNANQFHSGGDLIIFFKRVQPRESTGGA